jgi:bifunctional oligoribonuclease and PAP phosphatase NrnA
MQSVQLFYPQLIHPKKVVITTHQKPDGDAMGSSLGLMHFLQQLGHQVTVISPTNWANFLNWMPGAKDVIDFELHKEKATSILQEAELLFCLDFNVLYRTKHMEKVLEALQCTKILIDHHEQPQVEAFNYGISNTAKSSTCEMVYDFIVESGYASLLSNDVAICLYTGVMTDTGSFRFASTKAGVHKMVAHLKELGLQHHLVHENIYDTNLENRLRFIGNALLNRMEVIYELNTTLMYITKNDLLDFNMKTGETDGLVNYLLAIEGMKLGALVIDRGEERKWSFRSKGNFDVNTFARIHFEGGGHFNAAGGRSSDNLETTIKKFKQVIKQYENQLQ